MVMTVGHQPVAVGWQKKYGRCPMSVRQLPQQTWRETEDPAALTPLWQVKSNWTVCVDQPAAQASALRKQLFLLFVCWSKHPVAMI